MLASACTCNTTCPLVSSCAKKRYAACVCPQSPHAWGMLNPGFCASCSVKITVRLSSRASPSDSVSNSSSAQFVIPTVCHLPQPQTRNNHGGFGLVCNGMALGLQITSRNSNLRIDMRLRPLANLCLSQHTCEPCRRRTCATITSRELPFKSAIFPRAAGRLPCIALLLTPIGIQTWDAAS